MSFWAFILAVAIVWLLVIFTVWFAFGALNGAFLKKGEAFGAGATTAEIAFVMHQQNLILEQLSKLNEE